MMFPLEKYGYTFQTPLKEALSFEGKVSKYPISVIVSLLIAVMSITLIPAE